jgi:putative ABC transport system permease protein
MLRSYLELAWKVLGRRKFFTFVSLFGVSFTLMVLVVAVAIADHALGVQPPEVHQRRMLEAHRVLLLGHDTSAGANVGELFFSRYLRGLPGAERSSFYTNVGGVTSRLKGASYAVKRTDGDYWRILQFQFLEGGPFDDDDVRARRMVAVVTRSTADRQLGPGPALGKSVEVGGRHYRVVGVVADVSALRDVAYADVWAPLTTEPGRPPRPELLGYGSAVVLLTSAAAIPAAQEALRQRLAHFESPSPRRWQRIRAPLETSFATHARALFGEEADEGDHGRTLWMAMGLVAACFMLLPTVNLMNLNVSRILERAPEIGVRKSFGATSAALVGQFLVENLVLTLLGAALGMVLAAVVLHALSGSVLLPGADLQLDLRVSAIAAALAVAFGLISGIYPAWRMSRLRPVQALKGGDR